MAVRTIAVPVLFLILASVWHVNAQNNTLKVSPEVFSQLKALFAMKAENYISQQGEPLPTNQRNQNSNRGKIM